MLGADFAQTAKRAMNHCTQTYHNYWVFALRRLIVNKCLDYNCVSWPWRGFKGSIYSPSNGTQRLIAWASPTKGQELMKRNLNYNNCTRMWKEGGTRTREEGSSAGPRVGGQIKVINKSPWPCIHTRRVKQREATLPSHHQDHFAGASLQPEQQNAKHANLHARSTPRSVHHRDNLERKIIVCMWSS